MQLTTSSTGETSAGEQVYEDGITIQYWRVWQERGIDHFEVLLTLRVGGHRVIAQVQLRMETTLELVVDGRAITLEAAHDALGVALGENGNHLGPICVIDNDADGANDMA